ncbi:hypothetical_protein [Candidozyma auris]|uniref:hypothetical_protein n=1 Tax=Candidozyma auris TaxID=498019 RepID=UPI001252B71C|nr:hypothetical_protein [[Candida] auris]QEO23414.1 hypothetical_protein [[Candida] auris]
METGDSISIEDHTHKTLYQLYKKAHPKEFVLGWFDAFDTIDGSTGLIHDFYSKGADRAYPFPAIFLNVSFLKGDQISEPQLTTYIGAAIGKPGQVQRIGWKTTSTTNSFEKLALNLLHNTSQKDNSVILQQHEEGLATLQREIGAVTTELSQLLHYLDHMSGTDSDVDLLRTLSNTLLNKPTSLSDLRSLKEHFQSHNQDIVMIEFLTRAVKEQIELIARASSEAEKAIA